MNKAKNFSLVAAGMLIFYIVVATLTGKDMLPMALSDFTSLFNRIYIGMALLILLVLVLVSNLNINNFSRGTVQIWAAGFGAILIISTLTVYYVNPHGRFPTQRYLFTSPFARNIKSALYEKINYDPQLIIMGSSRAFLLSPEYVHQKTGYKSYNFSVEGATMIDFSWQLNYILDHKIEPPRVLVIDVAASIPSGLVPAATARSTFSLQPLSMLPYFSLDQQKEVLFAYGEDIFSFQSFSDSLYLMMHPFLTPDTQTWSYQEDGFGIRKPVTHEEYLNKLQYTMDNIEALGYFCAELDSEGVELLNQLVSNAEQHNIGVVLYQSPVNGTILQELIKNDWFYRCQELLTDNMNRLKNEHKNVWYISLIDDKSITDMREQGFYDVMHLRPGASQAVIDQLIPSIQSAVQWSEAQGK